MRTVHDGLVLTSAGLMSEEGVRRCRGGLSGMIVRGMWGVGRVAIGVRLGWFVYLEVGRMIVRRLVRCLWWIGW